MKCCEFKGQLNNHVESASATLCAPRPVSQALCAKRKNPMSDQIELVRVFNDNSQLAELYRSVALGSRSPQQIATAFHNSKYTIFALKSGRLVGVGRAFGSVRDRIY